MPDAKTDVEIIAEADAAAREKLNERTTGTFDPESYLAANPDVARDWYFGTRPELHWTTLGQNCRMELGGMVLS